ncbi:MAG: hypothetical protein JXM79_01600 [Sedimentisphaerales bacterium]|nr:hypothetical protein [Sedimentisphaerales bacterium]
MSRQWILPAAAAILILTGCTPTLLKPTEVCPGKKTVNEALAAFQLNSQNMIPFRADGHCFLEYYAEGKKTPQKEDLIVQQLWVEPPVNFYLQGDKHLIPRAIVLGSNEREFWLAIRPKEISLYVWGQWAEQESSEGPTINPRTLLEALGIGDIDTSEDWSLSNKGAYDILTKRERGAVTKKIYIFCCDYRVRKIEFFDSNGQIAAVAELDKYEDVSGGFHVPALIKVTTYSQTTKDKPFIFTLQLQRLRPTEINEPQRKFLFTRKPPDGFKNVGRIVNGQLINDSQ